MNVLEGVIQPSHLDFIHTSFKRAGFLVEENRPLKVCLFVPLTLSNPYLVLKIRLHR